MSHKIIKVGRSSDNDIVLSHPSVSRHHLEIFFDEHGNVFLTDLNSSNGTFVNGKRISESVKLKSNDIVKAGAEDLIRWKEYAPSESIETTGGFRNIENSITPTINKKRKLFKTIGITLGILSVIILTFFILNEFVFTDEKPPVVDPNKPNDTNDQPEKVSEKEREEIIYDFSCLEDENDLGTTKIIGVLEEIDNQVTNTIGGEISQNEERKVGEDLLRDCRQEYQFLETGIKIQNLKAILDHLTKQIIDPKGFEYSIYLLESNELNAFTAGGKIFVTTRMYNFCLSNDELACIIGHEINHNELGHIKQHLQKIKILSEPGAALSQMLTIPFGQKKETHCDLTGIDLAIAAGYNGCVNSGLWKRMKKESEEGDYNAIDNMFRSHPYSEKRSHCSMNHILQNYEFDCDEL